MKLREGLLLPGEESPTLPYLPWTALRAWAPLWGRRAKALTKTPVLVQGKGNAYISGSRQKPAETSRHLRCGTLLNLCLVSS